MSDTSGRPAATPATPPGPASRSGSVPPVDRRWRLRHLPLLLVVSTAVLVSAGAAGWWTSGGVGAAGAVLGVAVATASYTASTLVIAKADAISPQLVLPVGLGMYVTKFSLLGGMMVVAAGTGWPGLVPLGWGIAAGVVGWTGAQIWWVAKIHAPRQLMYLDS